MAESIMKTWREMTTQERSAYKAEKKAERKAAAEALAASRSFAEETERQEAAHQAHLQEEAERQAAIDARHEAHEQEASRPWEQEEFPEPDDDSEDRAFLDGPVEAAVEIEEWPEHEVEAPEPPLDREGLLAAIDPDLRAALSDDDIRQLLAEEEKRAADARKKKAMDKAREQIRHRMQVEHGLLDSATLRTREQNERLAKKIQIRFVLPADGSGDPSRGANGFRVDGRMLESGQWHTVTMAEYESLNRNFYDIIVNETQFSTLDQSRRAGVTTNNRLVGTTAARVLVSRAPTRIETRDVEALH